MRSSPALRGPAGVGSRGRGGGSGRSVGGRGRWRKQALAGTAQAGLVSSPKSESAPRQVRGSFELNLPMVVPCGFCR